MQYNRRVDAGCTVLDLPYAEVTRDASKEMPNLPRSPLADSVASPEK